MEQFRAADGARRMYQPYWLKEGQGIHLMTLDMDVNKFQTQIESGEVFIQDKYLEASDHITEIKKIIVIPKSENKNIEIH